jgi:phage N-6-adenine-methyltransferase
MGKVRAVRAESKLGNDLKRHRKEHGLTQAEFAEKAGIGERTVWLMEQGKGGLDSFHRVLEALGLSLFCRNGTGELPELIQTLRRRRSLSQAELAEQCGVTKPTIGTLERKEYDLQLMSWGDGSNVPTSGQGLVIAGLDNNSLLHIRTFDTTGLRTDTYEEMKGGALDLVTADASGHGLSDTPASNLPQAQAQAIAVLKRQLPGWLPPHVLSHAERNQVLNDATSITGQTLRKGQGRLATLERVLTVLGAGPYLAERDHRKSFYATTGNSSVGQAWSTPTELLSVLYRVYRFDLDPCSPRKDGPVKARVRFTADDDGLTLPWHGVVFCNPPYGRTIARWIAKARSEFETGNAKGVVLLIPARTDTSYWHAHISKASLVYFLKGRLRFGSSNKQSASAPFASALVVWGADAETAAKLDEAFPDAWRNGR